ncbi:MAG TPA: hypothetical protein VLG40_01970 [Candidatus Saccharimonas sp.]|nr:hypothetical protein [Candidatus Saccharimonas sp.]
MLRSIFRKICIAVVAIILLSVSPSEAFAADHRISNVAVHASHVDIKDVTIKWYSTGVVVTLNKTENGLVAASLIFLPVVAGLSSLGAVVLQDKVMLKAGWFQMQAAWFAVHGQCLWIWVPYVGDTDSGGYACK